MAEWSDIQAQKIRSSDHLTIAASPLHSAQQTTDIGQVKKGDLRKSLLHRLNPKNSARLLVGEQIQQSVGALPDIAYALPQFDKQGFPSQFLQLLIKEDAFEVAGPRNLAGSQCADEDIAFPFGETIPGIERHPGDGNRRHPEHDGGLVAGMTRTIVLPRPSVLASIADDRPAVIRTRFEDVDFITAVRSIFVEPHLAGSRVHRQTESAAVAQRVDLGPVAGASNERVVCGDAAVILEPQNFSAEIVGILSRVRSLRIGAGGCHEERAVAAECDA